MKNKRLLCKVGTKSFPNKLELKVQPKGYRASTLDGSMQGITLRKQAASTAALGSVSVCSHVWGYVHDCACAHVQKPEDDVKSVPPLLSA